MTSSELRSGHAAAAPDWVARATVLRVLILAAARPALGRLGTVAFPA